MKKYQQQDQEFWMIKGDRKLPMPYPGRYPTRWAVVVNDDKGAKVFRYVGKPNTEVALRVIKFSKTYSQIALWEFDRGGAFRYGNHVRDLRHSNYLLQFYYMCRLSINILEAWLVPNYPKQMILGKRRFVIYAPFPKVEFAVFDSLRRYKRWLGDVRPWNKLT